MKKTLIILFCLTAFILMSYCVEKAPFFSKLQANIQQNSVPASVLNYGTVGKVLKAAGLIRTMPNTSEYFPDTKQTGLKIVLSSNVVTRLEVFWAGKGEHYSATRSAGAEVLVGKHEYSFVLPDLNTINKLRLDPALGSAVIDIYAIRFEKFGKEQYKFKTVCKYTKACGGINNLVLSEEKISFNTVTEDPQFEIDLKRIRFDSLNNIEQQAFQRKRQKSVFAHVANTNRLHDFPGSMLVKPEHFKKKWPIVSMVVGEKDLFHPDIGIFPHKLEKGSYWERPAYISYFDSNGKLTYATTVGVRIHGGLRIQLFNSYRLYFRKKYGLTRFSAFRPRFPFSEGAAIPLRRVILHHTAWPPGGWVFNNVLSYDISRELGAYAPETQLVSLVLNGEEQGIYFLAPHLNKAFLAEQFGHSEFLFYKFRSEPSHESFVFYIDKFWRLFRVEKMTMEEVGKHVDLDNLVRHLFSFVFCGTTDFQQGVAVLDTSKPGGKIFWINWDMDHSFIDYSLGVEGRPLWQQRAWELVHDRTKYYCGRTQLFNRLLNEDPRFTDFVVSISMNILNHRLTSSFLRERVGYYTEMLNNYGIHDSSYPALLKEFMEKRPAFIRAEMEKRFHLGSSLLCRVKGKEGVVLEIDGYRKKSDYQGYYFKGKEVHIKIVDSQGNEFSHWIVNGQRVDKYPLVLAIEKETNIEPFFTSNE